MALWRRQGNAQFEESAPPRVGMPLEHKSLFALGLATSLDTAMNSDEWERPKLERQGFIGWIDWIHWPPAESDLPRTAGGVYVLYRASAEPPVFLDVSTGATHKGRDPSVSRAALESNWVDRAKVVYIGKADHGRLRDRLNEYRDMGVRPAGKHSGGRLIWQLADSADLLIAYRPLPLSTAPRAVEKQMIMDFKQACGKPPFANNPHMLGR